MKLNRSKLRTMILKEIFDKNSSYYDFRLAYDQVAPGRTLQFEYEFETDDGLDYFLTITLPMTVETQDGIPVDVHTKTWQVEFDTEFGGYEMTMSYDIKVLNTVIQIVKDFVSNIRPRLPDPFNQVIDFEASAQEEAGYGEKGMRDTRRARIYKYMMKKQGIDSEIFVDPKSGQLNIKFQI
jgi:hypothetical protein